MEKEIRSSIATALKKVNKANAPRVFQAIQSEQGYKNIEEMIIKMMIQERFTASACILHIERTL